MKRRRTAHPPAASGAGPAPGGQWRARIVAAALAVGLSMAAAGCNSMFFQPNDRLYFRPADFGLWHEPAHFTSADGTRLYGWFLPAQAPVRGTVVHFHGNAANISNHLYAVRWLPKAGYAVFLFDYRGYGRSEGSVSRAGAIADGVAAIEHVRQRPEVDPQRIVVYGQSLGGALAISALADAGTRGIQGLVVEGGFASYREVVRLILDTGWLTMPFQYPVAYLFFSDAHSPRDRLDEIADVPLLVIHGQRDRTVPPQAGWQLYEAFPGTDKTFWAVPEADHMQIFSPHNSPWRARLLAWLERKLGRPPRPPRRMPQIQADAPRRIPPGAGLREVVPASAPR